MSCERITAVVIGGGMVATRKAIALHEAGAIVRVVAPKVTQELASVASKSEKMSIELREYAGRSDLADAEVVFAATGTEADGRVAADARALHRLVSVASAPGDASFSSMAVHRAGPLAIGVSTGSVPSAARRIRDAIAKRFDGRYAAAVSACAEIRSSTLAAERFAEWRKLNEVLTGENFCERVENGTFEEALSEWR